MKSIIILTLIFGSLIGLMWWGRGVQRPRAGVSASSIEVKSTLMAAERVYDFGTISMKNGLVTKDFKVINPTSKDIFIPSLVTSCMCTKALIVEADGTTKGPFGMPSMGYVPPANETIKAGESRIIRAVYDPNAHGPAGVGTIDRFLTLTDASGAMLQFEIKAVVTP